MYKNISIAEGHENARESDRRKLHESDLPCQNSEFSPAKNQKTSRKNGLIVDVDRHNA